MVWVEFGLEWVKLSLAGFGFRLGFGLFRIGLGSNWVRIGFELSFGLALSYIWSGLSWI